MPYRFLELDEATRAFMLEELDLDLAVHGQSYESKILTERGALDYLDLMRAAITLHDEVWLTDRLNEEQRVSVKPVDAAWRLSRTEFNRYYIRAICRRASAHGSNTVFPYRAFESKVQRVDSSEMQNRPHPAPRILANLRGKAASGDPESDLGRVASGMTARCGCPKCYESL